MFLFSVACSRPTLTAVNAIPHSSLHCVRVCAGKPEPKKPKQVLNKCVLPPPLTDAKVVGDIILIRMSEESEPQNFTVKEYHAYVANPVLLSSDDEDDEDDDDDEAVDDDDGECVCARASDD